MNPDSRNFDSLRRLLKLKGHEQPPPGYFDRFSRDVMARIKAGETGVSFELPLWERFFGLFDVKPVFAGAFGVGVCALLISGVIAETDKPAPGQNGLAVAVGNAPEVSPGTIVVPPAPNTYYVDQSSTNGVSLFGQFPAVQAQQASFWVPNKN